MNISHWIDRWASYTPDKAAIWCEGDTITYDQMAARVARLASALATELGIEPGDRIAYLGYNDPRLLILMFACARLGAVVLPLNFRLAAEEHLFVLRDSGAAVLFVDQRFSAALAPIREQLGQCRVVAADGGDALDDGLSLTELLRGPAAEGVRFQGTLDSPLLLVYTSGTTGTPKGALINQSAVLWNALNSQLMYDLSRSDDALTTLPFFHVGGLNIQTTPVLHVGGTVSLMRTFEPGAFIELMAQRRPTLTVLVPAQILAISEHPGWEHLDVSSLRSMTTGSTMVPTSMLELWRERGIPVLQCYGCTESCPIAIHTPPGDAESAIGSVGKPAMYCEARIVDDEGRDVADGMPGEILLRGPNLFREYWGNPEATERSFRDGWFHTGDVGYRNEDGYYYVVDRKIRMIISGGENIYPAQLEGVLLDHPDIDEAAVVGYPDERWGEIAVAAVVNHSGKALDPEGLKGLFEGRLGRLKHPRHIVALSGLPRNAMGKVVYADVRSTLTAMLAD